MFRPICEVVEVRSIWRSISASLDASLLQELTLVLNRHPVGHITLSLSIEGFYYKINEHSNNNTSNMMQKR